MSSTSTPVMPTVLRKLRQREDLHAERLARVTEAYRSDEAEVRRRHMDNLSLAERACFVEGWNAAQLAAGHPERQLEVADSLPWSTARLHEAAFEEERVRAKVANLRAQVGRFRARGYQFGATRPEPGTMWEHAECALTSAVEELRRLHERV